MSCGKNWVTAVKVKVTAKIQNISECLPQQYFLNTEHFVPKPGMVMQHHKPECHTENLVHCVQCQGKGLYNQNMTYFCGIF